MIPNTIRISILVSLGLLIVAQLAFIPALLSGVFIVVWVYLFFRKQATQSVLHTVLIFGLTFLALASIYLRYQTFLGVEAGVAVLATFLFAKALESKSKRDVIILFNFAFFVSASLFLFSQSFAMAVMVLLCLTSCFIGLYRIQVAEFDENQKSNLIALKQDVWHVGKFLLYALPFFILLFLFFPRLPPLWHIPIPENKAVTGISDSMSPGDIAKLSQSSALAFRIIGHLNELPARSELYWRALVLDEYDGTRWTSSTLNQRVIQSNDVVSKRSKPFSYQYLAADPNIAWVMGLEQSISVNGQYLLGQDGRITPQRLNSRNEPISLMWVGATDLPINERQLNWQIKLNTQIVKDRDIKSQQLASALFAQSSGDPQKYVEQVIAWYQSHNFAYTLSPGTLGQNRVDDFLFHSRQGFCEHYASSFVMLMRYVGIPARVVAGYQGGQFAPDGKSWEVRQLDAHAWTEVWLNGKWQRYDPTAIVAPLRIDEGMQNYRESDRQTLGGNQSEWSYQQYALLTKMRIWGDYASYQWQSKVVGYNAESQRSWLQKLGGDSEYSSVLILIISMVMLLVMYFGWIRWKLFNQTSELERCIQHFNVKLPLTLQRQSSETFSGWMTRLSSLVQSQDQIYFKRLSHLYEQYMYAPKSESEEKIKEMKVLFKTCAFALKKL